MKTTHGFAFICFSAIALNAPLWAAERHYEANLDRAMWSVSASPLRCELSQEIPGYGRVSFVSHNGPANLLFYVRPLGARRYRQVEAKLQSQPPIWRPRGETVALTKAVQVRGPRPEIQVDEARAWRMLSELERGYQPTFVYRDWIDGRDQISVSLSVVRFQDSYLRFLQCVSDLLPFTFDDIKNLVLPFDFDSARFTREAKRKLERLVAYLKADPDVELVLLMGHTDSRGRQSYNRILSRKRAEAVKQYLVAQGFDEKRISVRAFGESVPVASNAHALGRAKNRRVVVRLFKD